MGHPVAGVLYLEMLEGLGVVASPGSEIIQLILDHEIYLQSQNHFLLDS